MSRRIVIRGQLNERGLPERPGSDGVWSRVHSGKPERDRLLLALFAYGGLRRSELLGLDHDDVDLELTSCVAP